MQRLRLLPCRGVAFIAEAADFRHRRRRGKHRLHRANDGRAVIIPDYRRQVIVATLLCKVIRDLGLTVDEYNQMADTL
jgi:hypothetical protein